ncbi:MAG: DNA polymerase III subunit alpha [Spirochaetia bacterium]|jgi:DNA polymerase-3 subunit alpha|nr:DNA polymerase III subunit alpha [Spirochaetia bacterium]
MAEFVHLHNHSDYSLLDGAAPIKELAATAKRYGMPGLAITDHGNLFGALSFYKACRDEGIKPIIGSEFYMAGGSRREKTGTENGNKYWHFILLAENQEGYRNLMKLSSLSYSEGFYYKPRIDGELLRSYSGGLIASSACLAGEIPSLILSGRREAAEAKALEYRELFGPERFYLELQDHGLEEQKLVNRELVALSRRHGIPLVATNDLHYINKEDAVAQDILLCVGTNRKRNDPGRMRFPNDHFYLKTAEEMAALFAEVPEALSNTLKITEMANLNIEFPGPMLPDYEIPPEFSSPEEYLSHLTMEGLERRYPNAGEEIRQRAEFELSVIISMGFTGYFLIVWDFIDWAKRHDIPVGPGRGSGAGSIVAYSLRITDIDPLKYDLLFERFLNPERISMPDFDVDFCFERRGEVIEYVTRKYGDDRVGQIITFGTLKAKAVVKDVARSLDISFEEANNIGKLIPEDPKMTLETAFEMEPRLRALAENEKYKDLFKIALRLENMHRHSSLHAAGIVIGKTQLMDFVPLYKDPKTGGISTQYTMDYLENCGLVKMDFLGLKTLTLIKNTLDLLKARGVEIREEDIPDNDPKTFRMLGEGKSTSIFQFESSGMQNILKRAKPASIEDLIALNALYRPGPMDFIDKFIDSKNGKIPISYPHSSLEKYLKGTYGVIVYQEQVMQVAREVAGYSLGRADLLRRAMGKKKPEILAKERAPFIEGALTRGYGAAQAEEIFDILTPFAGYGFNKSHAAAYSVVAYRTAFLKANYPAEFMAANLTNEINNTDKLTQYIGEVRSMGLAIRPPDINYSKAKFSVEGNDIVYGLLGIKGVGEGVAEAVVEERKSGGPFSSFVDFLARMSGAGLNKKILESLIHAGCFDSLDCKRKELMFNLERAIDWVAAKIDHESSRQQSLFDTDDETVFPPLVMEHSDEYSRQEMLDFEKSLLGFYFTGHPMDDFKTIWERSSTLDLGHPERASQDREYVLVAMLTEFREVVTKTGKKMAFGLLEDYSGSIEIVLFPDNLEQMREQLVVDRVYCFKGGFDASRGKPCLQVKELLDPSSLREKSYRELHVRMESPTEAGNYEEQNLTSLRDLIYSIHGQCSLFFHIPLQGGRKEALVRAGAHISCSALDKDLENLKSHPLISDVWRD